MKQVIGIYTYYIGNEPFWDSESKNLGGSETWTIMMASELQNMGYHVIVFGNPYRWHFSRNGVEYVPRGFFESRCEYQHFDYFISSRIAAELSNNINCERIFIMSHEANINWADTYASLKPNLFRKIICLSEWHKNSLIHQYEGLTDNRMAITFNGVDESLYSDVDMSKKRNMMVWSSCKERGLKYFIDAIFPCVKRMVPDFELVVCAYNNDIPESYKTLPGITVLGKLSKEELAEVQKQAKIWVYLNYGMDEETGFRAHETFCISAIENGFAKNAIVCSNATGLATTLGGYSGFIGTDMDLRLGGETLEKRNQLKNEAVDAAIKVLTDEEYRIKLAEESYEICKKYTWKHAAEEFVKIINS